MKTLIENDAPLDGDSTEHGREEIEIPTPSPSPARAASALLFAMLLLMIGNGLQGSLIGIRAELEGFSTLWTGLTMTGYFAGFLLGTGVAFRWLGDVGHIRVFAALASTASTAALIHAIAVTPMVWVGMRFLTGLCMSGLYVVAESWLNDSATTETRGRLLAAYMIVSMGGIGLGQFLLGTADPTATTLFVVTSVLISAAVVPISLSTSSAPPVELPEPMALRELVREVPTGVISMFAVGAAVGILIGLGPVYATRAGLSPSAVAVFVGASVAGAVVFQFPLGQLSDRAPRRGLMAAMTVAGTTIALTLGMIPAGSFVATALMFGLGGIAFPLYSLTVAYTNDWIPRSKMVGASTLLVRINGAGAVAGPLAATAVFITIGDRGFFPLIAVTYGIVSVYLLWRILVKDALPIERQRRWVPLPSRGSIAIHSIARRRRNEPVDR